MTQLFDTHERARTDGRRYNEPIYSFLNTSAWPSVERVREFWEGWFSRYHDARKPDLAARFRSYDNHPHLSAMLELFTFAALKRSGYELEIGPPAGSRALDFQASVSGRDFKFYAECTATGQRAEEAGVNALEADILHAIDKVPTGHFLLQVEFDGRGSQAPSVTRLRTELTSWLASLDHVTAIDEFRETNRLPGWTWEGGGWRIKFAALPAEADSGHDAGAIGIIGPRVLDMDQHLRLRRALDSKASRYGSLAAPLLVVINSTEYQRERDLMIALLGDVVWDVDLRYNHVSERFKLNGVFGSPASPRNVVLSAVLHGRFNVLNFAGEPMTLVHHPVASTPLPLGLFPFCEERHFDGGTGKLVTTPPSMRVGDFFNLPAGWPFFDDDPH